MPFQLEAELQKRISKNNTTMADYGSCGLWCGQTACICCTKESNRDEKVIIGKNGVENATMTAETNAI